MTQGNKPAPATADSSSLQLPKIDLNNLMDLDKMQAEQMETEIAKDKLKNPHKATGMNYKATSTPSSNYRTPTQAKTSSCSK